MVGQVNSFINIVMIKKAQWFWSKLETTSLEDTLMKLGKVRIFTNFSKFLISHNFPTFCVRAKTILHCNVKTKQFL